MSNISSIRASSIAERRTSAQQSYDRARVTSASTFPEPKASARESGFGVNASDRKFGRRSPFRPSVPAQKTTKPRESPRSLEHRTGSRKAGQDAAKGLSSLKSVHCPPLITPCSDMESPGIPHSVDFRPACIAYNYRASLFPRTR